MTDNHDITEEQVSAETQPNGVSKPCQEKVKLQYLSVKESGEFRERMGLSGIFYFVTGNNIKGGRK